MENVEGVDATSMFTACMAMMMGMTGLAVGGVDLAESGKAKLAAHDMFRIIDRQSTIDALRPVDFTPGSLRGEITFTNVEFRFPHRPEVQVLRGVSLRIAPGTKNAFVGPSGSGKSTLFQLILRFYDPAAGAVAVDGHALPSLNVRWWRQQLGLVSQEPVLFDASLAENLRYGKQDATDAELLAAAKLANMTFIRELGGQLIGFHDGVGPRGSQLSGGQKQRAAIARAVLRKPTLYLFDEATSALDTAGERAVQAALDQVAAGNTSLWIAHRLSTIADADRIFVLSDGKVVEEGKHDALVAMKGVYAKLAQA